MCLGAFKRAWGMSEPREKNSRKLMPLPTPSPPPPPVLTASATSKQSIYTWGQRVGEDSPRQIQNSGAQGSTSAVLPEYPGAYPWLPLRKVSSALCSDFLWLSFIGQCHRPQPEGRGGPGPRGSGWWHWNHDSWPETIMHFYPLVSSLPGLRLRGA